MNHGTKSETNRTSVDDCYKLSKAEQVSIERALGKFQFPVHPGAIQSLIKLSLSPSRLQIFESRKSNHTRNCLISIIVVDTRTERLSVSNDKWKISIGFGPRLTTAPLVESIKFYLLSKAKHSIPERKQTQSVCIVSKLRTFFLLLSTLSSSTTLRRQEMGIHFGY